MFPSAPNSEELMNGIVILPVTQAQYLGHHHTYVPLIPTTLSPSEIALKLPSTYSELLFSSPSLLSISYWATTITPNWSSCSTLDPFSLFSTESHRCLLIYRLDHITTLWLPVSFFLWPMRSGPYLATESLLPPSTKPHVSSHSCGNIASCS